MSPSRCGGGALIVAVVGSIPPSTLPLPERGVRVVPLLPLISTV